jgi:hypothetical protein
VAVGLALQLGLLDAVTQAAKAIAGRMIRPSRIVSINGLKDFKKTFTLTRQ